MNISKRKAALRELQKLVGVHEEGRNNHGRMVDIITHADTLPGDGYSWCQSTQNYAWKKANGENLAGGTASVWHFVSWASVRPRAAAVNPKDRPRVADHVTFAFKGGGPFDHVGQIERVLKVGPVMYLQTIEGNTGPTGSVSDPGTGRDGVYRKRRMVKRSSIDIVRVYGFCPHPERYMTPRDRWLTWVLGGRKGKRPNVPWRISQSWWKALKVELAKKRRPH